MKLKNFGWEFASKCAKDSLKIVNNILEYRHKISAFDANIADTEIWDIDLGFLHKFHKFLYRDWHVISDLLKNQ